MHSFFIYLLCFLCISTSSLFSISIPLYPSIFFLKYFSPCLLVLHYNRFLNLPLFFLLVALRLNAFFSSLSTPILLKWPYHTSCFSLMYSIILYDSKGFQIKLLIKNKLIICALGNLLKSPSWDGCHFYQAVRSWHYLPFYWWTNFAGLEIWMSDVRIPVLVQIFLLRSYNLKVCDNCVWLVMHNGWTIETSAFDSHCFEIYLWTYNGTITTPYFQAKEDFYKETDGMKMGSPFAYATLKSIPRKSRVIATTILFVNIYFFKDIKSRIKKSITKNSCCTTNHIYVWGSIWFTIAGIQVSKSMVKWEAEGK